MAFDTALNAVWLLLGVISLAFAIRARVCGSVRQRPGTAALHVIGVTLIVAALFPYISATDDVLRVQDFNQQHDSHHSGKKSQNADLIRLYETIDTPLLSHVQTIVLVLFFVALVFIPIVTCIRRTAPFESGRSPPFLLPA